MDRENSHLGLRKCFLLVCKAPSEIRIQGYGGWTTISYCLFLDDHTFLFSSSFSLWGVEITVQVWKITDHQNIVFFIVFPWIIQQFNEKYGVAKQLLLVFSIETKIFNISPEDELTSPFFPFFSHPLVYNLVFFYFTQSMYNSSLAELIQDYY